MSKRGAGESRRGAACMEEKRDGIVRRQACRTVLKGRVRLVVGGGTRREDNIQLAAFP